MQSRVDICARCPVAKAAHNSQLEEVSEMIATSLNASDYRHIAGSLSMLFHPKRQLTLKTFSPKKGSQKARAAGIQFVAAQQASPDTVIVAGQPGSGKTHLLHQGNRT